MTIKKAYDSWSKTYDQDENRTRDLDAKVFRRTLSKMRPLAALELGCGTGKNTLYLAKIAKAVTALDFSGGMIARAREKVAAKNVSFARADLTKKWPVARASFDLVVCDLVLEHIEDLDFVFSQARRVLKRGGLFFVCELHPFRQYQGAQANFGGKKVAAFTHHMSDFSGAAKVNRFTIERLDEWREPRAQGKPPRLVSFVFKAS